MRKVDDLMVVSSDEGVTALFRSTLSLLNLRRKVSEWKGRSAMRIARVTEMEQNEWLALRAAPPPAGPSAEAVPAAAASSAAGAPPNLMLAKRTTVADIKELAVGLTQAECHSLAVYFTLYGVEPVQDGGVATILEVKRRAAVAFGSPTESWVSEMQKHSPASFSPPEAIMRCDCRCGCTNMAQSMFVCGPRIGGYQARECIGDIVNRMVCAQCKHWTGGCHMCAKAPKRIKVKIPPIPTVAVRPLEWYFNAPEDMPWVKRTRDVALDPRLLRVEEVFKTRALENRARHARPFGWQDSLRAQCVFADRAGGEAQVSVRWAAFLENPAWRQLQVVTYIWEWLPDHLDFVGRVLHPEFNLPAFPPRLSEMPAPSTPEPPDSSDRIEELSEEAANDSVLDPATLEFMAERRARASAEEPPKDELTRQAEAVASLSEYLRSRKRKFDAIEDQQ